MYVLPGCFNKGDVLYLPFDTYDSNGASVTITGLAVTDIEIYKNGSTTQRSSDNGYTLLDTDGIDFDGVTGLHGFSIDTGDDTDSGFWADGAQYWINVNAITCDSQTVRFTYYLALGYSLRPTTKGRQLDVSTGGEAGIDWANVGSPTTTVGLSGTTVKTATDVETDTQDIQARLPAALTAGGNMKSDALALSGDTVAADNAEAFFDGTGYAGTNNVIPTVTTLTNLPAITANWLTAAGTAADFGTEVGAAVLSALGTGTWASAIPWNASWDAEVQSEVQDAIEVNRLDELLNADSDIDGAAPPTVGSVFHELMTKTAGSFTFDQATDSLEAIRDRGDSTWITATGFSTHTAADVWTSGTRTLTAGTNIQLPSNGLANVTTWTVAITGNITGNLSGSVGTATTIGSAGVDAVWAKAMTELAAVPGVTDSVLAALEWIFLLARNKVTETSNTQLLRNNADGATIGTATVSDDGTTFTRSKFT